MSVPSESNRPRASGEEGTGSYKEEGIGIKSSGFKKDWRWKSLGYHPLLFSIAGDEYRGTSVLVVHWFPGGAMSTKKNEYKNQFLP